MQRPTKRIDARPGTPRLPALVLALVLCIAAVGTGGGADYGGDGGDGAGEGAGADGAVGASTGVYSDDQRELGASVFATACAGCHGADLGGGVGPPLDGLVRWWSGRSVGALFRFVSTNMPMDRPGSLTPEEYAAALAHVLAVNGYPAGEEDLPHDADVLDGIVLDEPPEG